MSEYEVTLMVTVRVKVNDESTVITRATENMEDFHDFFRPPITTANGVVGYLAAAAASLGVWDASRLDGWGDVERGDAVMDVVDTQLEGVYQV